MAENTFVLLPGERLDSLNSRGLAVIQPEKGYRFSMDAVLLSHFCGLKKHGRAADLGTGCGVIPLLLTAREPTLTVDAVELDEAAAGRTRRSAAGNGLEESVRVFQGDLRDLPAALPRASFDLVTCNPPYGSTSPTGLARILPTTALLRTPSWPPKRCCGFPAASPAAGRPPACRKRWPSSPGTGFRSSGCGRSVPSPANALTSA